MTNIVQVQNTIGQQLDRDRLDPMCRQVPRNFAETNRKVSSSRDIQASLARYRSAYYNVDWSSVDELCQEMVSILSDTSQHALVRMERAGLERLDDENIYAVAVAHGLHSAMLELMLEDRALLADNYLTGMSFSCTVHLANGPLGAVTDDGEFRANVERVQAFLASSPTALDVVVDVSRLLLNLLEDDQADSRDVKCTLHDLLLFWSSLVDEPLHPFDGQAVQRLVADIYRKLLGPLASRE